LRRRAVALAQTPVLAPALDKPRKLLVRVPRGALQIAQGQPLVGPRQSQVATPRQHLRKVLIALVGTHARHRKPTPDVPARNARTCSSLVSFVSFMSIVMAPMIDPFTPLQTYSSLEIHACVPIPTMLNKISPCNSAQSAAHSNNALPYDHSSRRNDNGRHCSEPWIHLS